MVRAMNPANSSLSISSGDWPPASRIPSVCTITEAIKPGSLSERAEQNECLRESARPATRHLHREARFADPAGTGDRHQAHILPQQEFFGGSYFLLSPHKPVRCTGRLAGRVSTCLTGFSEKRSRMAASSRARSRVET
jgi:hypothetical protein